MSSTWQIPSSAHARWRPEVRPLSTCWMGPDWYEDSRRKWLGPGNECGILKFTWIYMMQSQTKANWYKIIQTGDHYILAYTSNHVWKHHMLKSYIIPFSTYSNCAKLALDMHEFHTLAQSIGNTTVDLIPHWNCARCTTISKQYHNSETDYRQMKLRKVWVSYEYLIWQQSRGQGADNRYVDLCDASNICWSWLIIDHYKTTI